MPALTAPALVNALKEGADTGLVEVMRRIEGFQRSVATGVAKAVVLADTLQVFLPKDFKQLVVTVPDPWVNIGTFFNSWSAYSAGLQPGYRVNTEGRVELRGAIKGGTFGAGSLAFSVPSALAPGLDNLNFAVDSNNAFGKAYVGGASAASPGGIIPFVGSATYLSLDGIGWLPSKPAPYVPACFPVDLAMTLSADPIGVWAWAVECNIDASPVSSPSAAALGIADFRTYASGGKRLLRLLNVPGLTLGKTYAVTVAALAGA